MRSYRPGRINVRGVQAACMIESAEERDPVKPETFETSKPSLVSATAVIFVKPGVSRPLFLPKDFFAV